MRTCLFKDGKKTGLWKPYHPNSKLMDEGEFTEDQRTGEWKYYDTEGNLTKTKAHRANEN